jgi:transposase
VKGVLKLMDKYSIIKLYQRGESFRSIGKSLGINRKTVAKYCNEYHAETECLETETDDPREAQERILAKPKYRSGSRKAHKYTAEMESLLDKILQDELEKSKQLGSRHKQALSYQQIFNRFVEAGHDIGLSTISSKIREKRTFTKECFIRQEYELGDRLEFDFGEVLLIIGGERKKLHLAVLSSPGSNFRWAFLYTSQKKEVFLSAHVDFFEMVGGVYREVVYDNMKNVVSKFIGKHEKELNEDLINLALYYGFSTNVTNAFSGNEKGHVEGSVKIIRREVYGPKYRFNTFEDAKEHLAGQLMRMNEGSEIKREIAHLLPYKPKLDLAEIRLVTINKYSFARVNNGVYSVPDYLVGKKLTAKMYHDFIKFYSNSHFVCEHKIVDGLNAVSIDIRHYLNTFKKKPGAIKNSLALKSMPRLKSIYDTYFTSNPKAFIEQLTTHQDLHYDVLVEKLRKHCCLEKSDNMNQSIALITENQLNMYNNLSIGKRH